MEGSHGAAEIAMSTRIAHVDMWMETWTERTTCPGGYRSAVQYYYCTCEQILLQTRFQVGFEKVQHRKII